jgi:hypothetical protein
MQLSPCQKENITKLNTNNPRVINITDTHFTQDETQPLSKGLKYYLHYKQKNWLDILSLEAETAINCLALDQ